MNIGGVANGICRFLPCIVSYNWISEIYFANLYMHAVKKYNENSNIIIYNILPQLLITPN